MKKLLILFSLFMLSCEQERNEENTSLIRGKAPEELVNKEIFLQFKRNDSLEILSSTIDDEGDFEFLIENISHPIQALLSRDTVRAVAKINLQNQFDNLYDFQFGTNTAPISNYKKIDQKMFALEEGIVNIIIKDSLYNANINGYRFNKDLEKLNANLNNNIAEYNDLMEKFKGFDSLAITDYPRFSNILALFEKNETAKQKIYSKFIINNPKSTVSIFALRNRNQGMNREIIDLYNYISDSIKDSEYGESTKSAIEFYKSNFENRPRMNQVFPDFELPNENGELIQLSDIKSKYYLIDFWASWCGPCRKANRGFNKWKDDFSEEDFQIVSVSVDKKKEDWLLANKEDGIEWVTLHDKTSQINNKLGIVSYPTSFLLDENFVVIDTELEPEALREKLTKLLK